MFAIESPFSIYTDTRDGSPLDGGFLFFGAANQNPETNPVAIYWDAAGTQPAAQPIRTLNGFIARSGTPATLYVVGDYSLTVRDKRGQFVYMQPTSAGWSLASVVASLAATIGALATAAGSAAIGFLQAGANAILRTVQDKLRDQVSALDYMTAAQVADVRAGTLTLDVTAAVQAAVTATAPGGTLTFPWGKYKLSDEIRLPNTIRIQGVGPGAFMNTLGPCIKQTNVAANAFTLVAAIGNFAFGQYGIVGNVFDNINIEGPSSGTLGLTGIGVDTSINGGNFHIRENTFTNVNVRYFTTDIALVGIAYLNRWYGGVISQCVTGVQIAKGAAPTAGGQTRFYGTTFDFCTSVGLSFNEDTTGGDVACFGCTFADGQRGISTQDESQLTLSGGNHFETLVGTAGGFGVGKGCGVYVLTPAAKANPNNGGNRTITGNTFLSNDADVWFDFQATTGSQSIFNYPATIDGNVMQSALAIKLTAPAGTLFGSPLFVIGESNAGASNGALAASQVSSIFFGTDRRKKRITRRYTFTGAYVSGTVMDVLPPTMVVTGARIYLTANASGFTTLNFGDQASGSRYLTVANAMTQALNTVILWTPTVPVTVIDGTNCLPRLVGTGGILGAAGFIEIDGYVP